MTIQKFDDNTNTLFQMNNDDYAIVNKKDGTIVVDAPDMAAVLKTAYGQKAFWKLYMADYIQVILGSMDYKQLDVFMYISMNTQPSTNMFVGTYQQISKGCGCSVDTVRRLVHKLIENEFMKKVQNGVYMVNPSIIMKGNNTKKAMLIQYYNTEEFSFNKPLPKSKALPRLAPGEEECEYEED